MGRPQALIIDVSGVARGNPGLAGVGVIVRNAAGREIDRLGRYLGLSGPAQAHFRAVITGLETARDRKAPQTTIRVTDKSIARFLQGRSPVRTPDLLPLYAEAQAITSQLPRVEFALTPADEGALVDEVANVALDSRGRRTAID